MYALWNECKMNEQNKILYVVLSTETKLNDSIETYELVIPSIHSSSKIIVKGIK